MQKTQKFYTPTNDVIFSNLFGKNKNKRFTKQFLEHLLEMKIKTIDVDKNTLLKREYNDTKESILDIKCLLNDDTQCNIEMQLADEGNIEKKHRKEIYSDDLEIYIVEMPKFRKKNNIDINNILTQWLLFIDYKNEGAIKMVKRSNKEIEEAAEELMRLNADKEVRRRAEMYELIEINARSARNYMLKKGRKEGLEKRHRKKQKRNSKKNEGRRNENRNY